MTEQKAIEIEAVNQKIEAVNRQIIFLRDQLTKTHDDIKQHMEKRDQLNAKAKIIRQEIIEIRKERDKLNTNVKNLKALRDEVREQMAPFIEQVKEHSQKIRELREKRSGESRQELQRAFDALEFKIATTTLDLKEEKRLIDQVKDIEVQLSVYKKMDVQSKKIAEIRAELKIFQDKADSFHKELTENAGKSQDLHTKMLAKFDEIKRIREEATNLHQMFLQSREKIRPLHEEIANCLLQRQKLFEERQEQFEERKKQFDQAKLESDNQKKAKEQEIKEKLGSQVRSKLERGEKLDLREFQLLANDDSETED